jgi:PhnB protein
MHAAQGEHTMAVKAKPDAFQSVTPYIIVEGAERLIAFAKAAFDAEEIMHLPGPAGRGVGHAELRIGDSIIMLSDASAQHPAMPCMLHVYVEDVDAVYQRALAAGATRVREVANQFYGDRAGGVRDACGVMWWIATHVEDVSPEELRRRAEEAMRKAAD